VALSPLETQVPLPPTLRQLDASRTLRSSERPLERLPTPSANRAAAPADLAALPSRLELPPPARMLDSPEPAPSRRSTAVERLSPLAPPSEREAVVSRLETPAPVRDDEGPPALPSAAPTLTTSSPPSAAAPLRRGDPDAPRSETGDRAASGAPDAGVRVGHDVATAPSASASAPPPLNLSLPRANAASVRRGPGMLELLAAPPDTKSKLEKALSEAERNDCRRAHADKGLLGALPLALDSARGKGCKW
jgi:Meckel syndrome type 1 protein